MKVVTKVIFVDQNNEKFFGEGPCRLLRAVEKTGSLRAGAMALGMAYTKALKLINHAEESLSFPLTIRVKGGKTGGGMILTEEGKEWLEKYEAYRDACARASQELYREYFTRE